MILKLTRLFTCLVALVVLAGGLQGCVQGEQSDNKAGQYSNRQTTDSARF